MYFVFEGKNLFNTTIYSRLLYLPGLFLTSRPGKPLIRVVLSINYVHGVFHKFGLSKEKWRTSQPREHKIPSTRTTSVEILGSSFPNLK